MIEFVCADEFIKNYERLHGLKVHKIPLEYSNGKRVLLLMCKRYQTWIALPYCNEAYAQTNFTQKEEYPFQFVETQDGNLLCTKNIHWEIRDTRAFSSNIYADKINFKITLQKDLMNIFSSNIRRKIRKANTVGIEIKTTGKHLIDDFYQIYTQRMYELKSINCSKDQIKKLLKHQTGKIFVAYLNNQPIGGATLIKRDDYSFENGLFATLPKYNHLYTTYALHYAMIQYTQQQNATFYYLGRSTRSSTVHNYKRHFHPQEIQLYWNYSHPTKNLRNSKLLKHLWSLLPKEIAKKIGGILYKRIPAL